MPIKFNDLFEFSTELDMAPYTLDYSRDGTGPPQVWVSVILSPINAGP